MIDLDIRLPLAHFTLEVSARCTGASVAVLGPSGAGKTSLLEVIAGLRKKSQGRVRLDESTLLDSGTGVDLPPEKRRVGYVPQDALLFPHLTVEDNVRFGLSGADAERTFAEAVAILEIDSLLARYPATLSGGERQRVALARALATQPRLLLLDEPLAAVDVELKARILPYLLRIRDERRIPILYVTHNAGEAEALCAEALLLRRGRIEGHGPTAEVVGPRALSGVDPSAIFDNIVDGTLEPSASVGVAILRLPGGLLAVPAVSGVGRGVYSVQPEEILLSLEPLERVSARNVLAGRVLSIDSFGNEAMVRVESAGVSWRAHVTAEALLDLSLTPGLPVWLVIKTHSLRRLQ